ncbi:MAG: exopolysaccharide Pel transporter PelG [Candidatus Eremiobacteraeota bacterium]|nr:exopolysaccharide Pel transporter PelG [Candidatus Eremiobacteraeota bacterium]
MAGIGFKLRAYTQEGTIGGIFRGYYHAALVAAGPWILTVVSLVVVQYLMRAQGDETRLFLELIIYVYAWTLITTAPIQLVVTRYLADQLDAQRLSTHMPTLVSVTLVNALVHMIIGGVFISFININWFMRFSAVALFVLVAQTWLVMAFIGALRAYHLVATSFVSGTAVNLIAAYTLGRYLSVNGYLMGMVVGQCAVLAVALASLAREFEFDISFNWDWLEYFKICPQLPLAGFIYYASVWMTLMFYWWGPEGYLIQTEILYAFPTIDLASFYAQMTIIPTITAFYVHCETSFYEDYRGFYNAILTKKPLEFIQQSRQRLKNRLRDSLFGLFLIQVAVTLGALTFAPQLQILLQWNDGERFMFRNVCLGAVPQVLLLFCQVILFYFQLYKEALWSSVVTFIGCLVGAFITLKFGQDYYGLGLLLGASLGCLVGYWKLFGQIDQLEYLTFSKQPMAEGIPFDREMMTPEGYLGKTILRDGKMIS